MSARIIRPLILTLVIFLAAAWVVWPNNPGIHIALGNTQIDRDIVVRQGLDLQGGLQVLLEADLPEGQTPSGDAMTTARQIVDNRVNALGVTEALVQRQGTNRIVVELPGVQDPSEAIGTLRTTGLLEFVDAGTTPLAEGQIIQTDCFNPSQVDCGAAQALAATSTAAVAPTTDPAAPTAAAEPTTVAEPTPAPTGPTLHTVMTGAALQSVQVITSQQRPGQFAIQFQLTSEGARLFGDHTSTHINQYLAIVLDKQVLSSPTIESPITSGDGVIEGSFTQEEANQLTVQLRYGSLPVPLKVVQTKTIGPTLGQDSIRQSITAGVIGLVTVALFMLLYYAIRDDVTYRP